MADDLEEVVVSTPRLPTPREQQSGGSFGSGPYQSPGEARRSSPTRSAPVPTPWGGGLDLEPANWETMPPPPPGVEVPVLPEVVVTAPAPQLPDLDPGGMFHVPTPYGPVVPGAPGSLPFNAPTVSPLRPSPPPPPPPVIPEPELTPGERYERRRFLMPEPTQLPEVKVEAKRPRPPSRVRVGVGAFLRGAAGVLGYGLAFLFVPRPANVGENERVRRLIEADLARRLAPVDVSVDRLAEPLATVTVRGSRLTDRPLTRTPSSLLGGTLRGPQFGRVRAPFVTTPTSFTQPAPQRLPQRRGVQATVQPLGGLIVGQPLPIPGRFLRPPATITAPRTPVAPSPSPSIPLPVTPGVRPIVGVSPGVVDLTGSSPVPLPFTQPAPSRSGRCVCPKPVQEKEPRRKRRPRVECRRGTYIETAMGLIKSPKEKVPCR